jgi:hypothetical protein
VPRRNSSGRAGLAPPQQFTVPCLCVGHDARGSFGDIHGVRYRAAVSASNRGRPAAVSCGLPLDRCAGYCALPGGRPSGTAPPSPLGMVGRSTVVPCVLPLDRYAGYCVSPGVMPAGSAPLSSLGIPDGTACMFCVFPPDRRATDCALPPFALWVLLVPASFRSTLGTAAKGGHNNSWSAGPSPPIPALLRARELPLEDRPACSSPAL